MGKFDIFYQNKDNFLKDFVFLNDQQITKNAKFGKREQNHLMNNF